MKTKLAILILILFGAGGSLSAQVIVNPTAGVATIDASKSASFKVPVSAAVTQVNIINGSPGQQIAIIFQENSVGGFAVAFGTGGPSTISGTCTVATTANTSTTCTANYDITANTWTLNTGGSSSGGAGATGIYLAQSCAGATAPCIQIPSSGGCYGHTNGTANVSVTLGSPTVTFTSGFPNPLPQVGQIAWVQNEQNFQDAAPVNLCGTITTLSTLIANSWAFTVYCGKRFSAGGTPVTITAVNQGAGTVTLSQNCAVSNSGGSAVLFYGPNIYSQLQTACESGPLLSGASVHLPTGIYMLDNGGHPESACGCVNGTNCTSTGNVTYSFGTLSGEGKFVTELYTPPWYDHENDLGTVLSGGQINDFTLDGTWTAVLNSNGRGTIYDGGACGSHDFAIVGYNLGLGNVSETIYPDQGITAGGDSSCSISNALIQTGNRGVGTGHVTFFNSLILSASIPLFKVGSGAVNSNIQINGGFYGSGGIVTNSSTTLGSVINHETGQSPSGDVYEIMNAELCQAGAANPAVNDTETSGEVRLVNVRINSSPACTLGANVGGVTIASGINLRLSQTSIGANGTGNPINAPSGSSVFNNGGNSTSGGAGNSIAGTFTSVPSESGTVTCATSAATITFKGIYSVNPIVLIQDQTTAGVVTQTSLSTTQKVVGCPGASDVLLYTVTPNPF